MPAQRKGNSRWVHKCVVEDLAGVEEPVAHLRQHQAVGVLDWHHVPEFNVVALLALISECMRILHLLGMYSLCKFLRVICQDFRFCACLNMCTPCSFC